MKTLKIWLPGYFVMLGFFVFQNKYLGFHPAKGRSDIPLYVLMSVIYWFFGGVFAWQEHNYNKAQAVRAECPHTNIRTTQTCTDCGKCL